MLLLSVCLRLSDEKFRENNVLTCPAGYSYYSTNHNDGVEDYFNQTDNGEFSKHGKINVMHMLRFRSTEPRTKTEAVRVLIVVNKTTQLQQTLYKIILQPLRFFPAFLSMKTATVCFAYAVGCLCHKFSRRIVSNYPSHFGLSTG